MDQITSLFQNDKVGPGDTGFGGSWLGQLLSSPGLKLALAGSGSIGNILANRSRNQVLSKEMAQMQALTNLTPDAMMKGINALKTPLSSNLVSSVGNTVQGNMASRGLSQAPGIFAQAMGQGLAPYELQSQQMAMDAYFKKLGLPISARPSPFGPFPNQTNTSQLWQSLMQQFMGLNKQLNPANNDKYTAGTPNGPYGPTSDQLGYTPPPDLGAPDWLTQMMTMGVAPSLTAPSGGGE